MSLTNYKLAKQYGTVYLYGRRGEVILSVSEDEWERIRETEPAPTVDELASKAFREWALTAEAPTKREVWLAAIRWYREQKGDKQ